MLQDWKKKKKKRYCDMMPESWSSGLSKQVPMEMTMHATIKDLPFLCNGEVNTPL
jgi:hypothetical protein